MAVTDRARFHGASEQICLPGAQGSSEAIEQVRGHLGGPLSGPSGAPVLFVIKPTSACNSACVYCSAAGASGGWAPLSAVDAEALLWKIARWCVEVRPGRGATLLWHGGEPLLMGKAFYRRVMKVTERIAQETGVHLGHAMQSNLLGVDREWAELLAELLLGKRIGTSFDPIPGIRVYRGRGDYASLWRRSVELLREQGLHVGIVWVVHREHLADPADMYRRFVALEHGGGLRINPLYAAGRGAAVGRLHLSSRDWGHFLWGLYRVWQEAGQTLRIDPFRSWDALVAGRPARLACALSGACTRGFTGIRGDGAVYSCGRSLDEDLAPFGRLDTQTLRQTLASSNRIALLHRTAWLRYTECAACRWWPLCHGGCPNDAYLTFGTPLARTGWCEGHRLFFERAYGTAPPAGGLSEPGDAGYLFDVGGHESARETP